MRIAAREKRAQKKLADTARAARRKRERPVLGALALPEDVLSGQARLTVLGCDCMLVENHTGVARLEDECVRVRTRQGMLEIGGKGLILCEARQGALCVRGEIHQISLPGKRGADDA